jgi:hypothetical protein
MANPSKPGGSVAIFNWTRQGGAESGGWDGELGAVWWAASVTEQGNVVWDIGVTKNDGRGKVHWAAPGRQLRD